MRVETARRNGHPEDDEVSKLYRHGTKLEAINNFCFSAIDSSWSHIYPNKAHKTPSLISDNLKDNMFQLSRFFAAPTYCLLFDGPAASYTLVATSTLASSR